MKTTKFSSVIFFTTLTFISVALTFASLTSSCKKPSAPNPDGYKYAIPQEFADGLQTASLESVGMSAGPIEEMMDYLKPANGKAIKS